MHLFAHNLARIRRAIALLKTAGIARSRDLVGTGVSRTQIRRLLLTDAGGGEVE